MTASLPQVGTRLDATLPDRPERSAGRPGVWRMYHNGGMTDDETQPLREEQETGAEGTGSEDTPPAAPSGDDESPLGDSDQHSTADA